MYKLTSFSPCFMLCSLIILQLKRSLSIETYGAFIPYNYDKDNPNGRFENVGALPEFDFMGVSNNGAYKLERKLFIYLFH